LSVRLDQRFASLKREGGAALVALTLILVSLATSQGLATADTLLPDSLNLQTVDGSGVIECPDQVQQRVGFESVCVTFPTQTDDGLRIFRGYRDQLSETGWLLNLQARDGYMFLRWLNAGCIERLLVLVPEPDTVAFAHARQPACGNERYNGDPTAEAPASLDPESFNGEFLFPGALSLRSIGRSDIVHCPPTIEQPSDFDVVCLNFSEPPDSASVSFGYFEQLSRDRWVFNDLVPPVYVFSRWVDANCVDKLLLGRSEQAPGLLLVAHLRHPICGEQRYGAQP
jgi:hypothetical protein